MIVVVAVGMMVNMTVIVGVIVVTAVTVIVRVVENCFVGCEQWRDN